MTTRTIDLDTNALSLEQIIAQLDSETEIVLMRGDTPIARIAPVVNISPRIKPRIMGLHQGQGWISDDFNDALN